MNKIYVYSKNEFREIINDIKGAVISIEGTPGCVEAYLVPVRDDNDNDHILPAGPDVFNVRFDDVRKDTVYNGKEIKAISEEQADAMVEFIENHIGQDFYIHCKAGKSRSQGVARFIISAYSDEYEMGNLDPGMMTPNIEVSRKLMRAYYKKHKMYEYAEKNIPDQDRNRPLITEEAMRDSGKYVRFFDDHVLLIGAIDLVDDYYWVGLCDDGKLRLYSCVGGYEVEENPESRFAEELWEIDYDKFEEEIRERLLEYIRKSIEYYMKRHDMVDKGEWPYTLNRDIMLKNGILFFRLRPQ